MYHSYHKDKLLNVFKQKQRLEVVFIFRFFQDESLRLRRKRKPKEKGHFSFFYDDSLFWFKDYLCHNGGIVDPLVNQGGF